MRDNAASPLWTDLYQLTMTAGYVATGRHELTSTFELSPRQGSGASIALLPAP